MPLTMTLLARKGGVGRTTIAVSLAGEFVQRGARVLCVDLDGQGSLSRTFFGSTMVESLDPTKTVAAIVSKYGVGEPDEVIHKTAIEGLSVVPAGESLEALAVPGVGERPETLRDWIREMDGLYDIVIIDTPPATGVATTWTALIASAYVLTPVPADAFGTQSIISVTRVVEDVGKVNQGIRILGYVLNQVQRNGVNDAYVRMTRQLHGSQVFETEIPQAVAFREAMAMRKPIGQHKPRSKAAKVINALADEIDQRITSYRERAAA